MKKLMALVLVAGVSVGGEAFASSHKDKEHDHHKYANPEMKVEKMAEKLSLTEEQKAEILSIMQAQHAQMEKMREAMRDSRTKTHDQIDQVLSEEQRKKYQKMRDKKYKDKHGKGHDDCYDD